MLCVSCFKNNQFMVVTKKESNKELNTPYSKVSLAFIVQCDRYTALQVL